MDVLIQPISPSDVVLAHAFFQRHFSVLFSSLPDVAAASYRKTWDEKKIAALSAHPEAVMLAAHMDEGALAGILFATPPEGGVVSIIWLAVAPAYQGCGIGKQLLQAARAQAKQLGAHKFKVFTPDSDVVNFYVRQGMRVEGAHAEHWWGKTFWALGWVL